MEDICVFKVGDVVKYGVNGICKITDITEKDFCGEAAEYYVLETMTGYASTYFVPTANEQLTSRMQHLLSREEALEVIAEIPQAKLEWIANDKERAAAFSNILTSNDRRDILRLSGLLYQKKHELESRGKKLHIADERIMLEAERIIGDELSTVLGVKKSEIPTFISERLKNIE